MFFWIIKILAYIPFWILFPTIIKNKKNLPSGKCVLVSNHRSNIDPLLLVNMIWREQHCLAKKELFKNWLLKAFLKGMKAIPVDRKNVEISTVKTCLKVLKNNKILTIFPEGTRNKTNNPLGEIKSEQSFWEQNTKQQFYQYCIKKNPNFFSLIN